MLGRLVVGSLLATLSALLFGTVPTLARLAMDGGADAYAILLARTIATILVCIPFLVRGRDRLPPPRALLACLITGWIWVAGAIAYILAYSRISVGVAVSVFYLYPLMVAAIVSAMNRRWPSEAVGAGLLLGFCGVGILVGVSFGDLDMVGVGLALVGALAAALNLTLSSVAMRWSTPFASSTAICVAALLPLSLLIAVDGASLPAGDDAILAFTGTTIASSVAIVLLYSAIRTIGSLPTAMIGNLEPAISIVMASVLLGEILSARQLLGAALILAGIIIAQARDFRTRRPTGTPNHT